jgi:hypothetical protein
MGKRDLCQLQLGAANLGTVPEKLTQMTGFSKSESGNAAIDLRSDQLAVSFVGDRLKTLLS